MRMVVLLFMIVACAAVFFSCEGKNPVEQYGNDVTRAYKQAGQSAEQASVKNLQDAIRSFQTMNGRYPNDLKELEQFAGTHLDSSKYEYDHSSGSISARKPE